MTRFHSSGQEARRLLQFVLCACLLATGVASAQTTALAPRAFIEFGTAGSTRAITGGFNWDWDRQWALAGGVFTGYWEASLSAWSYPTTEQRRTAWLGKLGVVPVLRYRFDGGASPWFVEGGIGLTMTTNLYETDQKRFSTRFNFGDHLAVGRSFGARGEHELALRVEHFSNAGIKHPNPGENFLQLRYGWRF